MASDKDPRLSGPEEVRDLLTHLILPLIRITYGGLAKDSRFMAAKMEEALRQDYLLTAWPKG